MECCPCIIKSPINKFLLHGHSEQFNIFLIFWLKTVWKKGFTYKIEHKLVLHFKVFSTTWLRIPVLNQHNWNFVKRQKICKILIKPFSPEFQYTVQCPTLVASSCLVASCRSSGTSELAASSQSARSSERYWSVFSKRDWYSCHFFWTSAKRFWQQIKLKATWFAKFD